MLKNILLAIVLPLVNVEEYFVVHCISIKKMEIILLAIVLL